MVHVTCHDSLSKTTVQDILEGGWHWCQQKKCWTTSKSRQPWPCQNSLWFPVEKTARRSMLPIMFPRWPNHSRDWTELNCIVLSVTNGDFHGFRFCWLLFFGALYTQLSQPGIFAVGNFSCFFLRKSSCQRVVLWGLINPWHLQSCARTTVNLLLEVVVMWACLEYLWSLVFSNFELCLMVSMFSMMILINW